MPKMKDVFAGDPHQTPRDHGFSPEEQETIDQIVSVIRKVAPESKKITLFGSRARNNYRSDSDYDIFVHLGPSGPSTMPGGEEHAQDLINRAFDKEFGDTIDCSAMCVIPDDSKAKPKSGNKDPYPDYYRPDGHFSFYATVVKGAKSPEKQIWP